MLTIPNILTLLNLLLGCASAAFAVNGNMYAAFWCIVAAAVADFLDGFVARLLNAYSDIGKQLDSLADVISFGFAPAFMLYMVMPSCPFDVFRLFPFLLTAFSALRLAKFNIDQRQTSSFIGLPTPANGLFFAALTLLYINENLPLNIWILMSAVLVFSYLLISEIPMFSLKIKGFSLKKYGVQYVFLLIALILLAAFQIKSVPAIIAVYLIISMICALFNKLKNRQIQHH